MLYCQNNFPKNPQKFKILVIEDGDFFHNTLQPLLSNEHNLDTDHASNFTQAQSLLEKEKYDFIISDFVLEDTYGEELITKIQKLSDAKIIILTAQPDIKVRERLFKIGVLDYLVKDQYFESSVKSIVQTMELIHKNTHNTILVIDSCESMKKELQNILTIRNYQVRLASTAKEAVQILSSCEINAVVLEIELPDKHGLELLMELKERDDFCHVPAMVLSANNNPEIVRKALKNGASDFITKPFNIEEFTLKADMLIENNRRYVEALCSQKMLSEYKDAVDESSLVSKTDPKGIITYANDQFCQLSGYSKKELIGSPHNIVRHPDMDPAVFQELWETIKAKKTWRGVVKNRKKNGEAYFVKSTIKPIVDIDGKILEYIAIRTDVTEIESYREILEENLSASNNNLAYLKQYEHAIDEYVAVIKTDPKGIIIYVNDNFLKLSGYTKEDLLGKPCRVLRAQKHIDQGDCDGIATKLENGEKVSILFENISKDDKSYYVDTKIFPLVDPEGNIQEHLHLMYNVTDIVEIHKELEATQKEIIYKMGEIGESRSKETGNHVKRVAEYSRILALLAGLGEEEAELLFAASPMHDIGKVAIPDAILNKPARLNEEEFEIMKRHTEIGYNILHSSKRKTLRSAAIVAHQHHERWDGKGYPQKLAGEDIHIFGRITAVADVFDALGSERCYKKAWELERIIDLFKEERGKQFDPQLIDLFIDNLDRFLEIRDRFAD